MATRSSPASQVLIHFFIPASQQTKSSESREIMSRLPPGAIYATLPAVELGQALGQASAWSLLCN